MNTPIDMPASRSSKPRTRTRSGRQRTSSATTTSTTPDVPILLPDLRNLPDLYFRAGDPLSPPDRRFRQARALLERNIDPRKWRYADRLTRVLVDLLRWLRDGGAEPRPALLSAFRLYESDLPEKWVLEAAVLARENSRMIAQRIKLSPKIVRWYRRCFFDVALDHPGYVLNRVLRGLRGGIEPSIPAVLKVLAFEGRTLLLNSLLCLFRLKRFLGSSNARIPPISDLGLRAMIAGMFLKGKPKTQHRLQRLALNAQAMEDSTGELGDIRRRRHFEDTIDLLRKVFTLRQRRLNPLLRIIVPTPAPRKNAPTEERSSS